jgi:pimeloyl-ACP methyl ester carboxylesterase
MDVREIQVPELRMAYRQAGTGPPLVLLHGGMGDSRAWTRQLDGLAGEYTVFAWDAPGCGHSTDVPETWRLSDYR